MRLDGDGFTEHGLDAPRSENAGRILLLACGALAREILALNAANGWDWFDLVCLPAKLHNTPRKIPEAVRAKIRAARQRGYQKVLVVYADCGTGGLLDAVCAEEGVERIPGPHCYSFFDGNDAFAERAEGGEEIGAFYLTDFLARQFETLIWCGLGMDRRPELREIYFGNYDRLVYLAQTEDPVLDRAARAAARRLGLDYVRRLTGYGDLAGFLKSAAIR